MPYGQWLPNGRHVRAALVGRLCACLRFESARSVLSILPTNVNRLSTTARPHLQSPRPAGNIIRYIPGITERGPHGSSLHEPCPLEAPRGRRPQRRPSDIDYITPALRIIGKSDAVPQDTGKDSSFVDVQHRGRWSRLGRRRPQQLPAFPMTTAEPPLLSLQYITGRYIQYLGAAPEGMSLHLSGTQFDLAPSEAEFIHQRGYSLDDIRECAKMLSAENTMRAASLLSEWTARHGVYSVPLFAFLYLLRRRSIPARALVIFLTHAIEYFTSRPDKTKWFEADSRPLFIAVIRLLRHSREVWPQAMPAIAELYLQHWEHARKLPHALEPHHLSRQTYRLNKLMTLISRSTAVQPFKDAVQQEAALVRVLRYMSEHDPPIQISREGYRAFARVQLTQRKTPANQQWAELKALSWPPWKVDRTAMDADIGPDHGLTKAGATLRQMHAAGYSSLAWETAARIYMGWDTDGTPTIHTRTVFDKAHKQYLQRSALWVARIGSTRTVQEAWACYLAWEDEKLPPDQQIYLAIFQKLYEEERRLNSEPSASHDPSEGNLPAWKLFPGDYRELEPLPPSTHLYTFTRTDPPSVGQFYDYLRNAGVYFGGHCLAFLVATAQSLPLGIQRLSDSCVKYPENRELLTIPVSGDVQKVANSILAGTIELFTRFCSHSHVHSKRTFISRPEQPVAREPVKQLLESQPNPSPDHFLVHSIELLRRSCTRFVPAWYSVLRGLTRQANFPSIGAAFRDHSNAFHVELRDLDPVEIERCAGAITAYRLVLRVLSLFHANQIELDSVGFHFLCVATENLAIASLYVFKVDVANSAGAAPRNNDSLFARQRDILKNTLRARPYVRLKRQFEYLVGEESGRVSAAKRRLSHREDDPAGEGAALDQAESPPNPLDGKLRDHPVDLIPRLLAVPKPALLHAYVRALGWFADHDTLAALVDWMAAHRDELAERERLDRTGAGMMRRTIVALRAFLERSWMEHPLAARDVASFRHGGNLRYPERLEVPASPELIDRIRAVIEHVGYWGPWPSDDEVRLYCADKKFDRFRQ